MNLSTNYNKALILIATIILAVGPQILAQADALGITPTVANWISLGVSVVGAITHILVPNQNQPTIQAGQAVVNKSAIPAGTPTVVEHKP